MSGLRGSSPGIDDVCRDGWPCGHLLQQLCHCLKPTKDNPDIVILRGKGEAAVEKFKNDTVGACSNNFYVAFMQAARFNRFSLCCAQRCRIFPILFAGGPEFGEKHLGLATGSARGPENGEG